VEGTGTTSAPTRGCEGVAIHLAVTQLISTVCENVLCGINDVGIVERRPVVEYLLQRFLAGVRWPIGTVGDHSLNYVSDGEDSGFEEDVRAQKAARIS
jgi:hypothetical protein